MAVKIDMTMPEKSGEKPYPKLMIGGDSGNVILFTSRGIGTVVRSGGEKLGKYSCDWNHTAFVDFEGELCMRNE
jgi:hypothetical protein